MAHFSPLSPTWRHYSRQPDYVNGAGPVIFLNSARDLRSGAGLRASRIRDCAEIQELAPQSCRTARERPLLRPRRRPVRSSGEPACKPGSVWDSHSSGTRVTARLERPTRKRARAALAVSPPPLPYLALLQVGFAVPPSVTTGAVRSYRTLSPLPAPRTALRRFALCCTFRGLAPPRRYLAPARRSPDFPPHPRRAGCSDCPAGSPPSTIAAFGRRAKSGPSRRFGACADRHRCVYPQPPSRPLRAATSSMASS